MSQPRVDELIAFLKTLLELSPAKANALILRDDYEEQIEITDPDDVAMHRDRALELLAWRTVQGAVHVFRQGGLSEYLPSTRGEDLAVLYCCERLSSRYETELAKTQDQELTIPVAIPPDDDLIALPGLIELQTVSPKAGWITLWGEWTDLLGEPPDRIDWVNAVANAISEARKRALTERPSTALGELFDKVENIQSLQTVLGDLIERLLSKFEQSAYEQAFKSLQAILGRRLDGLCNEAQASLIASMQIRLARDFADPSAAMMCLGRAIELQLRHLTGKQFYPDFTWKKKLYPEWKNNLGTFLTNLRNLFGPERATFAQKWCDPSRAYRILSEFNDARNRATHGEPQAKHVVDSAVDSWLGAGPNASELWTVLAPKQME
jgi:hypothetical protein